MDRPVNQNAGALVEGLMILIPAFNEELSLSGLLADTAQALPGIPVVVIDDGSSDNTAAVARQCGATVLSVPCNCGVGGAVQLGLQYAASHGYEHVLRMDGDGQHPPSEAWRLLVAMRDDPCDLIVGSRFGGGGSTTTTFVRRIGIQCLAVLLSKICRSRVTDPTSGFWLLRRRLIAVFAREYPRDYPEPEALALLRRLGYSFREVPVAFRERTAGRSSIGRWSAFYFTLKVGLALCVDRVKPVNPRLAARNG